MARRSTIQDVANLAGVSKVTVSYVLNGRGAEARISTQTALKVRKASKTLEYTPNRIAKMLATQRTDTIAVVLQKAQFFSSWSSFLSEVMHGVAQGVVENDFDLLMHTKDHDNDSSGTKGLLDGRIDGVLAIRDQGDPLIDSLISASIPTVLFFSKDPENRTPWIDTDNYQGGRMAAEHFISLGHKTFGYVTGPDKSMSSTDRMSGYRDVIRENGFQLKDEDIVQISEPSQSYRGLIDQLQSERRPSAIFVWSDDVAFGCLRACNELGIQVPQEVSIIGFDSTERCDTVYPSLTSIRQPIFDIALQAVTLLARAVRGETIEEPSYLFTPTLELRASTAVCLETTLPQLKYKELL